MCREGSRRLLLVCRSLRYFVDSQLLHSCQGPPRKSPSGLVGRLRNEELLSKLCNLWIHFQWYAVPLLIAPTHRTRTILAIYLMDVGCA